MPSEPITWPTTRDEIPGALDQLAAQVADLLGENTDTFIELRNLYGVSCREIAEQEADEAAGVLQDREEYEAAHACQRAAEARAINKENLR